VVTRSRLSCSKWTLISKTFNEFCGIEFRVGCLSVNIFVAYYWAEYAVSCSGLTAASHCPELGNPLHTLTFSFFRTHCNIALPHMTMSTVWSLRPKFCTRYVCLQSLLRVSAISFWSDHVNNHVQWRGNWLSNSVRNFLLPPGLSPLLVPQILLSTLCSNLCSPCSSDRVRILMSYQNETTGETMIFLT
jgi:hypothetical protein